MITGVRTAIFCESAEQREGGSVDILGAFGGKLHAAHKPGLMRLALYLEVESDEQASIYNLRIEAEDLDMRVRTPVPAGWRVASAMYPVVIPVPKPGRLTVSVTDAARPNKVWKIDWGLDYIPGVKVLPNAAEARAEARQIAADWARDMQEAGDARSFN